MIGVRTSIKQVTVFIFAFLFSIPAISQILDNKSVKSRILGRDVSYSVYLPNDYDSNHRTYPVIYLLHGYGDDHTTWIEKGNIAWYVDQAIQEGTIPPVIVIMPDAGVSMYVNAFDGKNDYEDFFISEFIPKVESTFRIRSNKYSRGITGHSKGGWGCLLYAFKHPELFAATAPMSAGVHDDHDIEFYDDQLWNPILGRSLART